MSLNIKEFIIRLLSKGIIINNKLININILAFALIFSLSSKNQQKNVNISDNQMIKI